MTQVARLRYCRSWASWIPMLNAYITDSIDSDTSVLVIYQRFAFDTVAIDTTTVAFDTKTAIHSVSRKILPY